MEGFNFHELYAFYNIDVSLSLSKAGADKERLKVYRKSVEELKHIMQNNLLNKIIFNTTSR